MTQIFITSSDLTYSAKTIDNIRLNKNIVEATQVFTQNEFGFGGQGNPAPYRMWKGYGDFLGLYIVEMYKEWQLRLTKGLRGGVMFHKSGEYILSVLDISNGVYKPYWINDEHIYSSYRSALLYKNYSWYSQFGWNEQPAIPTKIDKKGNVTLPYYYGLHLDK